MKEIIDLRKPREKHYENSDGTITAYIYDEDVHYLDNGKYKEIDTSLIEYDEYYENKYNVFNTKFSKDNSYLYEVIKDNHYLKVKSNETFKMQKEENTITYKGEKLDIKYDIKRGKVKENIILKEKNNFNLNFILETDLTLELKNNTIEAKYNDKIIFLLESPYMYDSKKEYNKNIKYKLEENILSLELDTEWLNSDVRIYPVVIDPTITNDPRENVYDTYISNNNEDYPLNNEKVSFGVFDNVIDNEEKHNIYRTLLKFVLPEIGTGYTITKANVYLNMKEYVSEILLQYRQRFAVHEISTTWDEETATWNNMKDNYNERVETSFIYNDAVIKDKTEEKETLTFEITSLVKEWYTGKPNNGIMIKQVDETATEKTYIYDAYSKTYDIVNQSSKRPVMTITYKSQEGILNYMDYTSLNYTNGTSHININNGNVVHLFNLNKTLSNKLPVNISLVYTTENGVKNRSYKLSLLETLELKTIDSLEHILYIDGTNANYYFPKTETDTYKDEDGLNLTIKKIEETYEMTDKYNNKKIFENINEKLVLTKIIDSEENEINITYENDKITKITDASNEEINIKYSSDLITITSKSETSIISLNNNLVTSIETKYGKSYITYNDNKIITKIINDKGIGINFEYYETNPYKLKKAQEIGLNNKLGKSKEFTYSYKNTRITDNNGLSMVYSFNDNGQTINEALYTKESNKLKDAYTNESKYYDYPNAGVLKNKLASKLPNRHYINNLLTNGNFEVLDEAKCNFELNGPEIVDNNGNRYLSVKNNDSITFNITEENYYTLSFDFNYNITDENGFYKLLLYGVTDTNEELKESYIVNKVTGEEEEDIRIKLTGHFSSQEKIVLKIQSNDSSILKIDNMQLEIGKVGNLPNIISNSSFENGLDSWKITGDYEIVTLETGEKAIKIKSDLTKDITLSQQVASYGKRGDIYELSFWYKNEGVKQGFGVGTEGNQVTVNMFHVNGEMGSGSDVIPLKPHNTEWQFITIPFIADWDYEKVSLHIMSLHEANALYITNVMLTKDARRKSYNYDEFGNIKSIYGLDKETTTLKYDKNNKLISMFNPKGNNFKYEYDNLKQDRIRKGISPTGISNEIKYDKNSNPIKTIINNVNPDDEIKEEHKYEIRLKGTEKYFNINFNTTIIGLKEDTCNHQNFKIEKEIINETEYYRFKVGYKYVNVLNDVVRLTKDNLDTSLFILDKCDNGSYILIPKTDYTKNISYVDNELTITDKDKEKSENQFYFEDIDTPLYIENKSYYTPDGKFITCVEDSLGKKTYYDVDKNTGLTKSITNAKGDKTLYNYNSKNQLINVSNKEKQVYYNYNGNDLLSNIKTGNKDYSFTYDDFLNKNSIKINNNTLITHEYEENNGNLVKSTYGNGFINTFSYDNLNRLSKLKLDNKEYEYYYDNFGNISKIISDDELYTYYYDLSGKLTRYIYNEYKVDNIYDQNGNIKKQTLNKNNIPFEIVTYEYNKDDNVTKVIVDGQEINYNYDYLGRLINKNINNNLNIEYKYITNGNKTSLVLESMKIDNDTYKYIYDELYNITEIYLNNTLTNTYTYDVFNELIEEKDYINNRRHLYVYDKEGNILVKKEFNLETEELIKTDTYEYNNPAWEDQLTKYNNELITYDEVGNPLTIGNKTLTWKNGRRLASYTDTNLNITYDYNMNGIRKSKIVNGIKTEYYVVGSDILVENRNGNMIYYIYDGTEVIGFKINEEIYYYKKNFQGDVIGIYNSSFEEVVKYKYDSWGKVISITDTNGNNITDTTSIGIINPIRYRSYYYDEETKLYYLNSRYYNPEWGRFINIDEMLVQSNLNSLGFNLYVYVNNNPIRYYDSNGQSLRSAWKKTKRFLKKVCNTIKEGIEYVWNEVKEHFVADVGYGLGGSIDDIGLGLTYDESYVYKDGEVKRYTENTFASNMVVVSGSQTYRHYDHYGNQAEIVDARMCQNDTNLILSFKDVATCEYATISDSLQISDPLGMEITINEDGSKTLFVGLNLDFHVIIGGHVKIGLEIDL